jgi:hypothetical protein
MERKYEVGASVVYVDPQGKAHNALVNIWWTGVNAYYSDGKEPGCNLLWISSDPLKTDTYGQQIERATSVVHKSFQPAHGNFWCWPDEV